MKKYYFLLFLISSASISFAQNQIGLLPQLHVDFKAGKDWKVNSKLEGRQLFFQNPYPEGQSELGFERPELAVVATKSLDAIPSFGGGYLIRRQDGLFLHRFIQQFSITQKLIGSRISHRLRTDQTLEKDEAVQLRLRYRFSWEKPLNGMELDPKEMYLKLNNEYLGILQDTKGNLEIRGLASLGFNLSDDTQIETGVDYRAESLINTKVVHKGFLN